MIFERTIKPTITPCILDKNDILRLTLSSGKKWEMKLLDASAEVVKRRDDMVIDSGHESGDIAAYGFDAEVEINGHKTTVHREVASDNTFYEPWEIDGVRIWFDATSRIFSARGGFMAEKDWRGGFVCCPARLTRWAVQEAGIPICPEPLHDWYPNPSGKLHTSECYVGYDCFMGPYNGGAAHGGLDINMPNGTILTTPIDVDDQFLYNSLAAGNNNNRWSGFRKWADKSIWELTVCHLVDMLVPEHIPLKAGTPFATTAGTFVGAREHSHFVWRIYDQQGTYFLDPWILMHEIWAQRAK